MSILCARCGAENLTPEEMDEAAGYPLDHDLTRKFTPELETIVLTVREAKSLLGVGNYPRWLAAKIKEVEA